MDPNRYTEKAREAILAAQQIADRGGQPELLPEHLLLALILQTDGIVPALLGKMNVPIDRLASGVEAAIKRLPSVRGGAQAAASARLRKVLDAAEQEASHLKDDFTS